MQFIRLGHIIFLFVSPLAYASDQTSSLAKQCENISCVRKHMDLINQKILDLIGERTEFVRQAGIIKGPTLPSEDQKRVQDQLSWVKEYATNKKIPLEIAIPTFETLIQTSIQFQQNYKDHYFNNLKKGENES